MKKNKKKENNNTKNNPRVSKESGSGKLRHPWHVYEDNLTWENRSVNEKWFREFAIRIRQYPEKIRQEEKENEIPKISLADVYKTEGMAKQTYYDFLEKFPFLKDAHEEAKADIGDYLYAKSLVYKINFNALRHRLHRYGLEAKQDDEHHKLLKIQESGNEGITVIMQEAPDCPEVLPAPLLSKTKEKIIDEKEKKQKIEQMKNLYETFAAELSEEEEEEYQKQVAEFGDIHKKLVERKKVLLRNKKNKYEVKPKNKIKKTS